jgi:succinyl-diaminopimelate desuccinylase
MRLGSYKDMQIKEKIDAYTDDIVGGIARLVQIKSCNEAACKNMPYGCGCADALKEALAIGAQLGFETKNLDNYAGYIEMGAGDDVIGILCHVDVVPEGGGWKHKPYELCIEDGRLYGRGVCDDKGPLVAALYAMKIAREIQPALPKRVRLVIGANEECGCGCVKHYKDVEGGFKMGFSPDGEFPVIFGEKGYYHIDMLAALSRTPGGGVIRSISAGSVRNAVPDYCECVVSNEADAGDVMDKFFSFLTANKLDGNVSVVPGGLLLSIAGKAAHSSLPHLGVNAASFMLKFLGGVTDESPFVNTYNALFGTETTGQKAGIACSDKYGALTLNAGVITTESDGTVRLTIDIRYPVTADFTPYAEILKQKISDCGAREIFVMAEKPLLIDPESPLVMQLMDAYRTVTGDCDSKPRVIGGGTYAKSFENVDAFGPEFDGDDNRMHDSDENISLDRLKQAIEIYVHAI